MELDFFTFILVGIIFSVGYFLGEAVTLYRLRESIKDIAKALDIDISEFESEKSDDVKVIKVRRLEAETVNDTIYLYDKETRDFICQGKTMAELAKFAKDYKSIIGAVVLHGDKVFVFSDGDYKEYMPNEG